jgi:segregation and condensation protein A
MSDYKVQFEVFEGPLDLLLYLIRKAEVDIYQVDLTRIATEFVAYLELMRELDLEVAGEFLVMASTLLYLKSRELLPVDQQAEPDVDDQEEDPRWELIRQLVAYKKFKDAAVQLQELETRQEQVFARLVPPPALGPEPQLKSSVSLFDLLHAVNSVLKRFSQREDLRDIFEDKWSVSDKLQFLHQLLRDRPRLNFSELFTQATSRSEVVVTFLALLELIRLKQVSVAQPEPFSEIQICRTDQETGLAVGVPNPIAERLPAPTGSDPA